MNALRHLKNEVVHTATHNAATTHTHRLPLLHQLLMLCIQLIIQGFQHPFTMEPSAVLELIFVYSDLRQHRKKDLGKQ